MEYLQRGSSAVDWCESNYQVTSHIAEFFNTISNALFFIVPPLMISLFKDFGKQVTNGIHVIWFMLVVVGIGSVYFHATLTMAGQLMDELSILWVLMTSYTILFPDKYLPIFFHKKKNLWYLVLALITVIITFLCFLKPALNAYFLMLFAFPIMTLLYTLVKSSPKKIIRLAKRVVVTWFFSVTCWIIDRIFCDLWIKIKFPYFHSIFHVFIFLTSYSLIVLFAYFAADYRVPNLKPAIVYWPSFIKHEFLRIPYIDFTYLKKQNKNPTIIYSQNLTSKSNKNS